MAEDQSIMVAMSPKLFIGLMLCNLIWSVHPIMGKWLLESVTPIQGAWLRYVSALLSYWVFAGAMKLGWIRFYGQKSFEFPKSKHDRVFLLLLGFSAFCFSPMIQMMGLSSSLATENALIITIEPFMTAFLAWLFLNEKINVKVCFAFLMALIGFALLAGSVHQNVDQDKKSHLIGNLLILISLVGEANYTILGRKLMGKYSPLGIFGASLSFGVLFLSFSIFYGIGSFGFPHLNQFTLKSIIALLWLGPMGTAGAYLYYMYALVKVPVMNISLFLFLQPLAGAVWGYLFLGDRLTPLQLVGGGMILFSLLLPHLIRIKIKKRPKH